MDKSIGIIGFIIFLNAIIIWLLTLLLKKNSENRVRQDIFLKNIGDSVIAVDKQLKIMVFNTAASHLTNFSSKEAVGKPVSQIIKLINEKDRSENVIFLGDPLLFGETVRMIQNILLVTKSGKEIPIGLTAAPVLDAKGTNLGAIIVFRDISQEREVIKMKDEFVSLASHELRTPMTAIDGYVDMVLEGRYGEVPPNFLEPLGNVAQSVERLIRLVEDLLNVGHIDSERIKLNLEEANLSKITSRVITELQPLAEQKQIKLFTITKRGVKVLVDIDKVNQILHNTIGNAIKFTDKGKVSVSVKKSSKFGLVEIKDTGVGIPPKEQPKIFAKFFQVSGSSGRPPGTGLGLYISKQTAQKMGGDVFLLTSKPMIGSTFVIKLPLISKK